MINIIDMPKLLSVVLGGHSFHLSMNSKFESKLIIMM